MLYATLSFIATVEASKVDGATVVDAGCPEEFPHRGFRLNDVCFNDVVTALFAGPCNTWCCTNPDGCEQYGCGSRPCDVPKVVPECAKPREEMSLATDGCSCDFTNRYSYRLLGLDANSFAESEESCNDLCLNDPKCDVTDIVPTDEGLLCQALGSAMRTDRSELPLGFHPRGNCNPEAKCFAKIVVPEAMELQFQGCCEFAGKEEMPLMGSWNDLYVDTVEDCLNLCLNDDECEAAQLESVADQHLPQDQQAPMLVGGKQICQGLKGGVRTTRADLPQGLEAGCLPGWQFCFVKKLA